METLAEGTRLYINITNRCNVKCPFCCMYSSPDKSTDMSFDTFKTIIDDCDGKFELQLEGGEPTLHLSLFAFIEYALQTGRCNRIIILTNGNKVHELAYDLNRIANRTTTLIELKVSVNYFLAEEYIDNFNSYRSYFFDLNKLVFATKYLPWLKVRFNVRLRNKGDNQLLDLASKYLGLDRCNVFHLQAYGRLKGSPDYKGITICQNIQNWKIYASTGKCFNQDLEARSEFEKEVN
jgi:MoaA/NifB/PqqE/SkfB family radical SAM enzyme